WDEPARNWWVPGYGQWWSEDRGGLDWYTWMFESRAVVHADTLAWIRSHDGTADAIDSLADFGCGLGVGYAEALGDRRYVGFDLSERNVAWCRSHRDAPRHAWSDRDFICEAPEERFDLVMSSGTIDNAYDADAFLTAMVRASRRFVHLTCYRGWFPQLEEHRYRWSDEHHCFYNDLSPRRIAERLEALGCVEIRVEPLATGNPALPYETRVTARVPEGGGGS
ncbi:MAG: class I SAM-dependent methyltransferase, partial [Myxococcales bacterium]|nr:class I SAM-dependent methyltransferase [Myxococcales bacterium]